MKTFIWDMEDKKFLSGKTCKICRKTLDIQRFPKERGSISNICYSCKAEIEIMTNE